MRMARHSQRTVTTLQGVTHLTLKVYRCRNTGCPRFHQATRPEEEGRWALPHGEFGLDVLALVGALRYQEQRSIPQIHHELQRRGVQIASRTVTDQLYRYEELLALSPSRPETLAGAFGRTRAGHPGSGRVATRCWAGGAVGLARLLFGRSAAGA
jgi:hypothetical protein